MCARNPEQLAAVIGRVMVLMYLDDDLSQGQAVEQARTAVPGGENFTSDEVNEELERLTRSPGESVNEISYG
jgi:hypothetical protein